MGGLDLRTCTDFTGEDDTTAGPYYGAARRGGSVLGAVGWYEPLIDFGGRVLPFRCPAFEIPLEGRKRGGGRERISGAVSGAAFGQAQSGSVRR